MRIFKIESSVCLLFLGGAGNWIRFSSDKDGCEKTGREDRTDVR